MKRLMMIVVALWCAMAIADFNSALDCPGLTFTTGGDAEWFEQSDAKVGGSALTSGGISDGQSTWLETTVSGSGMISFWWKVSSEDVDYDFLSVVVDGDEKDKIGGIGRDWTLKTVPIVGDGEHIVRWTYAKDDSATSGQDCGWLDSVTWTPAPESMTITFETNGGEELEPEILEPGATYGELPIPNHDTLEFMGWYLDAGLTQKAEADDVVPFVDATLYARWGISVATMSTEDISFSADDGWLVEVGTGPNGHDSITAIAYGYSLNVNVTGAGMLTFKCRPTADRDSRTWGCYMCVNGDYEEMFSYQDGKWLDCLVILSGESNVVQHIEWCASDGKTELSDFVWTPAPESITITFETNGGEELEPEILEPGATYGDLPVPTHDTLVFVGWYLDAGLTQKAEEDDVIPFVDATLYARWGISVETMNTEGISFSTDGGWCVEEGTGPNGHYSIASYANDENWDGINGLFADVTGAGTLTFKFRPTEDKDCWRWSCNMFVNGNYEGFYTSYRNGKWQDCSILIRGKLDDVQRIEWHTRSGKTELSDFAWTPAPESTTISFETNGAGELDSVVLSPSNIVQYSDILPLLSRGGYVLVGWYLDPGFTKRLDENQTIGFDDITLYARWELSVEVMDTDDIKFSAPKGSCWYAKKSSDANGGYAATRWSSNQWVDDGFLKVNTVGYGYLSLDAQAADWDSVDIQYSINGGAVQEYYGFSYLDSDGVFRSDANLTLMVVSDSATFTNEIALSISNWGEVNNTLYNFTWTPAPESMTVSFDSAGGSKVSANTYVPGESFGELPVPTRDGCTFLGWIKGNVLGGVAVKEDELVPFNDVMLVAKWAANEISALPDAFTDVAFVPQESSARQVVAADGGSVVEFVFDFGDDTWSMSGMTAQTTCAGYLSFEIGIPQGFLGSEPIISIDNKEATVRCETVEKSSEVVWTRYHVAVPDGQHNISWLFTAWCFADEGWQPFAWIRNVEFEPSAPQKDVFSWADKLVTYHSWITNDLGRFAQSYNARVAEDETDYEARLYHAATILAQLGENEAVARYAAQFGYSIDYLGLTVSAICERDVSSWPSVNDVVDEAFDVALPVFSEAYADVSAIPLDWTGSIKLAAEKFRLDEDVYLDLGDVMLIRSGLEAAISLLHFAKSYDWTVNYESADAARAEVDAHRRMYKLITEQTNFVAKVRNSDSLVTSKDWMSAALRRVLDAAAFMRARPAEGDMHFFEYDPALCDEWAQATNLVTKALASLDVAQGVDMAEEVVSSYGSCNTALLPNDGFIQIYLGALFSGRITQDLRPAVNLDGEGKIAVDFATMKDPTIAGLLPDFTTETWSGIYSSATNGIHVLLSEAVPEVLGDEGVAMALKGSKDPELKKNIVDAESYELYREWARTVRGKDGTSVAGTRAVKGSAHAAAAYLLGAERLLENEPTVEIGELAIAEGESAGTTAMTVAVTVKDGESTVAVDAEKVAAMFEATGDLGDWTGAAKLTPNVKASGTDASGKMTFVVTPGDGTADRAFLRIKR